MSTVPTGVPAWVRTASHDIYGGDVAKTNWQSQGVTNPLTDVGAESFVRMCADLAAVSRTAPFATLTVLCDDGTPAPPTIIVVNQMTGVRLVSYVGNAAPAGFPSAARNGNGDVTLTWANSYTDSYGVSGFLNIAHAQATVSSSAAAVATAVISDADADGHAETVRVRCFLFPSGTAPVSPRFTLEIST